MSSISTTRRMLTAYAQSEPWKEHHDEAEACMDIEEMMSWGITLLRGVEHQESRVQNLAMRSANPLRLELMALDFVPLYVEWLQVSRLVDAEAEKFVERGYEVACLNEFRLAIEEAEAMVELDAFGAGLPTIGEAKALVRPENPEPDRYGD